MAYRVQVIKVEKKSSIPPNLFVLPSLKIPFQVKRIYWINEMKIDQLRGNHAHKELSQIAFCVSGELIFTFVYKDGRNETVKINSLNDEALYIPPGVWRTFQATIEKSCLMVIADKDYNEDDYIRNFEIYQKS